jgi:hypothetical protein
MNKLKDKGTLHHPPPMMYRPEKDAVSFDFEGTAVIGSIISSTDLKPHYHWFLLKDKTLMNIFEDTIAFKEVDGELKEVHFSVKHLDFITAVKDCVRKHLELIS